MSDDRDFFLDDLLNFLGKRLMELDTVDYVCVSDKDVLKDYKYHTINIPFKDTKLTFYKVVDLNDDFTGLIYCNTEYEVIAQNVIFSKNESGNKFCEKIREENISYLPKFKTIEDNMVKLMVCNDFEGMVECFKKNYNNFIEKKNGKKKRSAELISDCNGAVVTKQKVEKKKVEKDEEKIELLKDNLNRDNQSILGAINYSISFFENNFKKKDEGELHLDCMGKKGHHFPSITLTALKVASLYAQFSTYTKTPKNEWLRDLQVNVNEGQNVESIVKKLYEKKSELENKLKD